MRYLRVTDRVFRPDWWVRAARTHLGATGSSRTVEAFDAIVAELGGAEALDVPAAMLVAGLVWNELMIGEPALTHPECSAWVGEPVTWGMR